jgi:outer membrane protein OmpA-like peptidoglycan-associated protein
MLFAKGIAMKLHYLTLALAALATSALAADKPAAAAPAVAPAAAPAVAANGAPKSPEEWLARMTDFTKNASAFRDPKVFMPWSNTVSDPSFYVAMMSGAQDPAAWLNMMNSATNPNAMRNYMQFSDPALYMRWMNAGMDPAFYTAFMTQFSDPAKMMRWAMMPMDPKVWSAMMNMANPNMYMKWAMAPMDPRAWGTMGNMMNPATYMGFMGAGMDPKAYGPWGSWFNYTPQAPMGGVTNPWSGPTAGAGFNFFDPNAMMGMFTGLVPGLQAPAAAAPAAAAPAAAAAKPVATAPAGPTSKLTLAGDALFKLNKSSIRDLSKEGKAQLDEIVTKIKAMGQIEQIKVVGHADPTGKQATNLKLSQARAKAIKSYLVSQGVKSDVIISSGVGDAQPVAQCDAKLPKQQLRDCHAPNRRVEIEITAKK